MPLTHVDNSRCSHIPHLWRRQFCGLVVGLDEAVKKIVSQMRSSFGNNAILIVSSDNGGSPWFGGLNEPFRGSKSTPYEGGVHVPAFAVDFSFDHRYFGANTEDRTGRRFDGLVHISDWMPTLLTLANVDPHNFPKNMDGMDISEHLKARPVSVVTDSPRKEVLLELVPSDNAVLISTDAFAYRIGDFKYIKGFPRDAHWYSEPRKDYLNSTDTSYMPYFAEMCLRFFEHLFGAGAFDTTRITT
jgi:arylsulfatase A-like enzyme